MWKNDGLNRLGVEIGEGGRCGGFIGIYNVYFLLVFNWLGLKYMKKGVCKKD